MPYTGRCDFIEFINHMAQQTGKVRIGGQGRPVASGPVNPAKVPSTLNRKNPDPNQAAQIGNWEGHDSLIPEDRRKPNDPAYQMGYTGKYDKTVLCGIPKEKQGEVKIKHGEVLTKMTDWVQAARRTGRADATILTRIRNSMDMVILARKADMAEGLGRDFNKVYVLRSAIDIYNL